MSNLKSMNIVKFCVALSVTALTSCSYVRDHFDSERFASKGVVVVSLPVPAAEGEVYVSNTLVASPNQDTAEPEMAPLLGYLPPVASYLPSENEVWVQIDRQSLKIAVYRGNTMIKEFAAEGSVSLNAGDYFVQLKQKDPVWYAPDAYFAARELVVPSADDRVRYRRGALGKFAIYPTDNFPIHSAAVWSPEVGGVRVSSADLASIYYLIPLGAPIVVK
jgi:hypothetical protein